jgi:hypothetical protein
LRKSRKGQDRVGGKGTDRTEEGKDRINRKTSEKAY